MKARAVFLGTLFILALATRVPAQEKTIFTLEWLILGSHAGFFVALDNGFFKDQGLDVTIHPGRGSGRTVKLVGLKTSDFGMADLGTMIIGRTKGIKNRMTAMIIAKAPYVLYSLEPNAVRTPKDLEGKKIATTKGNATYLLFPALAKINNINADKVHWIIMNRGSMIPSLLAGKVDLSAHYTGSGPIVEAKAAKQGKKAVPFLYKDWGLKIYSNGLITHEDTVSKRPRIIRRFLAGALKGIAWAMEHQNEAIANLAKHKPALNRKVAARSWQIRVGEILTNEAKKNGIGYMTAEKVRNTRDLVVKYFHADRTPPLKEIYTNEFLPRVMPPKGM